MAATALHPPCRDRPDGCFKVYLRPECSPNLSRPGCGQHDELERQPDSWINVGSSPDLADSSGNFTMRQGAVMLLAAFLSREGFKHRVSSRAVLPVALGDRPFHDSGDPLPDPSGCFRFGVPYRRQTVQHVSCCDLIHPHRADSRQHIRSETGPPVFFGRAALPPASVQSDHRLSRPCEGWHPVGAQSHWVATVQCHLSIVECFRPCLGQAHIWVAA